MARDSVALLEEVEFRYPVGDFALRVPRLDLEAGVSVAVIGPSGSGKTTLLHLIAGIAAVDSGRIVTDGVDLQQLDDAARRSFRVSRVGLVFQEFELLEYLTVRENILLPYRISPELVLDEEVRSRAASLAERVGVADKLERKARRLSQGEKQRAAVCRALIAEPRLVLADEPTGNLDPDSKQRVLDILFERAHDLNATLVVVTHDRDLVGRFDRSIDVKDFYGRRQAT
jgi:putative ABC transport system ATP-binding protein